MAINGSDAPVTLVAARLLAPAGSHPEVSQTWVAPLLPYTDRAIATQWPADPPVNESTLSGVEGFTIPAGARVYFTFLVDVRDEGVWEWPAMTLTYVSDGEQYTEKVNNAFKICSPVPAGGTCSNE